MVFKKTDQKCEFPEESLYKDTDQGERPHQKLRVFNSKYRFVSSIAQTHHLIAQSFFCEWKQPVDCRSLQNQSTLCIPIYSDTAQTFAFLKTGTGE